MPRIPRSNLHKMEDIFRLSQTYLFLRAAKLDAEHKFTAASKPIKSWLTANGKTDADGNRVYKFDRVMQGADGKTYSGVMLKRGQGPAYFDPAEVIAFVKASSAFSTSRVVKTVEVPDLDELYVLQQEGKITEEELRGLMHDPEPSYSLWPVEAAVTEEDE
jgi:hypothetical protein